MRTRSQSHVEKTSKRHRTENQRGRGGRRANDEEDGSDSSGHDQASSDDVKVLSKKPDAAQKVPTPKLGRGHRVHREIDFFESIATTPRAAPHRQPMLKAERRRSGGHSLEEVEHMVRSRHSPRKAAQKALREMTGMDSNGSGGDDDDDDDDEESDDDNDDGNDSRGAGRQSGRRKRRSGGGSDEESEYASQVRHSTRATTTRLRRAVEGTKHRREGALDDIDEDAFRDASDESADRNNGFVEDDTDSSEGITGVTKAEAVALTKKRGTINHVLQHSKAMAAPLSGNTGTAERDLNRRAAANSKRGRPSGEAAFPPLDSQGSFGPGFGDSQGGITAVPPSSPTAAQLGDVSALAVDPSITFASVGGLPSHILALRECVLVPLLYPALMERLQLRPPRGMLFVGPPGTGKTLVARALANEGRANGRNITFFMRKGADILSKWVGESERQLRMLFDEARRRQPSVIFFDEIDGLAPVRHAKQEQSHAALVSTLLAMLDGLDDRGQVVVIGATNRVDTIDPALRRPGRFDRELYFPLPDTPGRRHMLHIMLQRRDKAPPGPTTSPRLAKAKTTVASPPPKKQHPAAKQTQDVDDDDGEAQLQRASTGTVVALDRDTVVDRLVAETQGFSGADLNALVTEASLCALRRVVPQLYATSRRLQLPAAAELPPQLEDYLLALRRVQPSVQRSAAAHDTPKLDLIAEDLVSTLRDVATANLGALWHPITSALRARREATDDIALAAARLSRVPALTVPTQLCAVVAPEVPTGTHADTSGFAAGLRGPCPEDAHAVAIAIASGLPTIPTRVVSLPIAVGAHQGSAAADPLAEFDGLQSASVHGGDLLGFCASVRRCAPCIVLVNGFDHWTSTGPDQGTIDFARFAFSTLSSSDVLFLVPCDGAPAVRKLIRNIFGSQPNMQVCDIAVGGPQIRDVSSALTRVCTRMVEFATGGANDPSAWEQLPEDTSPQRPDGSRHRHVHRTPQERALAQQRWTRIQYKRTQLRHILRSWLMTFIAHRTYSVFNDKDLDLHPDRDSADLKAWRNHSRGRRIGLLDVLEKLDNSEYTCLSQYNDDIDTLHQNVLGFFSHRDQRGLRYRTRATQLRDATILNNHKIHPNLIAFTEETREEDEPVESSSEDGSEEEEDAGDDDQHGGKSDDDGAAQAVKPRRPARRRRRRGRDTTPRRRKPIKRVAPQVLEAADEGDEHDDATSPPKIEGETMMGTASAAAHNTKGDADAVAHPSERVATPVTKGTVCGETTLSTAADVVALLLSAMQGANVAGLHTMHSAAAADWRLPVGATSMHRALGRALQQWLVECGASETTATKSAPVEASDALERAHAHLSRALLRST
jgi:SpoVK/Ycf46/Vps4 family AAA+-type ATPase